MLRLVLALGILGCATAGEAPAGGADDDPGAGGPDARTGVIYDEPPDAPPAPSFDAAPPDAAPCAGGQRSAVDPVTGACYLLFTAPMIWPNAKGACETMTPRAHLVTISDAEEAALVASLASGFEPWIGLNDVIVDGTYGWVTAETFAFTDWAAGEPNDSGDCVRLQGGRWADMACTLDRPYLCERP